MIISTGWSPSSVVFYLDKQLYEIPGMPEEERHSLTMEDAQRLISSGKAVKTKVPHL